MFRSAVLASIVFAAQIALAQESASGAETIVAGKVELVEGDVRFFDQHGIGKRPALGDRVYVGDRIVTGHDGEVHLAMQDDAYIGVRPDTNMRFMVYRAEGDDDDRSVIRLLKGSFRSVTGWIASLGPDNYVVRTPTATIGVRGTEHEPLVLPDGSKEGSAGTYERVYVGETVIRTPRGEVSLKPNQAGFASRSGARPRVLERIPAFFRPTRNEARFDGMHERIHLELDKKREERREFMEQRRQQLEHRGEHDAASGGTRETHKSHPEQHRRKRRQLTEDQKALLEERHARSQEMR